MAEARFSALSAEGPDAGQDPDAGQEQEGLVRVVVWAGLMVRCLAAAPVGSLFLAGASAVIDSITRTEQAANSGCERPPSRVQPAG